MNRQQENSPNQTEEGHTAGKREAGCVPPPNVGAGAAASDPVTNTATNVATYFYEGGWESATDTGSESDNAGDSKQESTASGRLLRGLAAATTEESGDEIAAPEGDSRDGKSEQRFLSKEQKMQAHLEG